jgi:hypothetical protein
MKPSPKVPVKKPYHAPKLIVYGDLTDLTRNVGMQLNKFDKAKIIRQLDLFF